jgi:drug/metabolite transporter (DMT)-like permease
MTLWCSLVLLKKPISLTRRRAVWPVVVGVAMACVGDRMSVTTAGFVYTFLCVVLASVKVVASSELLTGSRKLHPVELLSYMAPAAFLQCCILSVITNEAAEIRNRSDLNPMNGDWTPVSVLLLSGFLAFTMNICALQAYKLTSPLTCCIAAAVKQVLMIVASTLFFHITVTPLNGMGIAVVLVGSAYYSYVSVKEQTSVQDKTNKDEGTDVIADDDDSESGLEEIPLIAAAERGAVVRR